MTSAFFSLETATRALRAQQTLVDIANQNISNANTPGYSRQVGVVKETRAYPIPVFRQSGEAGQIGTGVAITEVNRARDTFADFQIRNQMSSQGRWDAQSAALTQIDQTLGHLSDVKAQVGARLFEFGLLRAFHPLIPARIAALLNPLGSACLAALGPVGITFFAILHGAGNDSADPEYSQNEADGWTHAPSLRLTRVKDVTPGKSRETGQQTEGSNDEQRRRRQGPVEGSGR